MKSIEEIAKDFQDNEKKINRKVVELGRRAQKKALLSVRAKKVFDNGRGLDYDKRKGGGKK